MEPSVEDIRLVEPVVTDRQAAPTQVRTPTLTTLAIASIGIVYGDIGTSPIYALRESLNPFAAAKEVSFFVQFAAARCRRAD